MRHLKKVSLVLLAIALLLSVLPVAYAADYNKEPGDTFTVKFEIPNNYGLEGKIKFGDELIESCVISRAEHSTGGDASTGTLTYVFVGKSLGTSVVECNVTLKSDVYGEDTITLVYSEILDEFGAQTADKEFTRTIAIKAPEPPAHDHDWELVDTVEPTCTKDGYEAYKCACGEEKTETITATGDHAWAWTYDKEYHSQYCETCGEKTKAVPHTFVNGMCECGYEQPSVPGTPVCDHKGTWGEWKVTKPATCTEEGVETRTCKNPDCGATQTRSIPALGHNWSKWTETEKATCTEKGEETSTCSVCGKEETRIVKPLGHKYDDPVKIDGTYHKYTCKRCGDSYKEKHDFNEHDGYCACGYKKATTSTPSTDGLDDVPKTGDITPYITASVAAVISMAAALVFVFKRKTAK